jgi:hypothetical protein
VFEVLSQMEMVMATATATATVMFVMELR